MQDRRPPRQAPEWKRWHVITIGGLAAFTAGVAALSNGSSGEARLDGQNAPEASVTPVAAVQSCKNRNVREEDAMMRTDTVLRQMPAAGAQAISNPASPPAAGDRDALATVTMDVPLRQICKEGNWSRVRVLATGLRWMEGWVPATALRAIKLDPQGRRRLTYADIDWQPGSERDKAAILNIASLILRDDERCEAIDNRSLLVEGEGRSRRYTLSCDGPAGTHPITFSAGDATGRSFKMVAAADNAETAAPISKLAALDACSDAIRGSLHQPKSADFHTFTDTTFHVEGSRARFTVGFSAKNGLGLETDATAACIFEGERLVAAEILPSGS